MSETIKVVNSAYEGGFMIIDKADFNPETMKEFVAKHPEKATEPKTEAVKSPKKGE